MTRFRIQETKLSGRSDSDLCQTMTKLFLIIKQWLRSSAVLFILLFETRFVECKHSAPRLPRFLNTLIFRCIKPNPESRPGSLTPPYVLEQLRAGGVLEAVRIASAGFPTRKPFRFDLNVLCTQTDKLRLQANQGNTSSNTVAWKFQGKKFNVLFRGSLDKQKLSISKLELLCETRKPCRVSYYLCWAKILTFLYFLLKICISEVDYSFPPIYLRGDQFFWLWKCILQAICTALLCAFGIREGKLWAPGHESPWGGRSSQNLSPDFASY